MARKIIVVTAAYGNDHVKALGGQSAVLPFIAGSGADGVEIRRELFSADELNRLPELAATILSAAACWFAIPRRKPCLPQTARSTRVSPTFAGSADP
jgi:hypothetical protein